MWDEKSYRFPKFKEIRINNFIPHFTAHVITYPCWDLSLTMLVKGVQGKRATGTMRHVKNGMLKQLYHWERFVLDFMLISKDFLTFSDQLMTVPFSNQKPGLKIFGRYFDFNVEFIHHSSDESGTINTFTCLIITQYICKYYLQNLHYFVPASMYWDRHISFSWPWADFHSIRLRAIQSYNLITTHWMDLTTEAM